MTRPGDAVHAANAGASYVGAILVPSSPRAVTPERAAALGEATSVPLVVVTADLTADEAARAATVAGAEVVQLHGDEGLDLVRELRDRGKWALWKTTRVRTADDVSRAVDLFADAVDLLLFEGWHPNGLGGMGARFPWETLAAVRDDLQARVSVGVAGGLDPENVADAVRELRPDLVDVSSGVESAPGIKEATRVEAFVRGARAGAGAVR